MASDKFAGLPAEHQGFAGFADGQQQTDPECTSYTEAMAEVSRLRAALAAKEAELQLAIAHDRQPYPTAAAYERVCNVLDTTKAILREAQDLGQRQLDRAEHAESALTTEQARVSQLEQERDDWKLVFEKANDDVGKLYADLSALRTENTQLRKSAIEVAELNQPNLLQIMLLSTNLSALRASVDVVVNKMREASYSYNPDLWAANVREVRDWIKLLTATTGGGA